jgi:hypothetical protein
MSPRLDFRSSAEKNLRTLENIWLEVQSSWQDGKASHFEDTHINSITQEAQQLIQALEQLQELIQSSERLFPQK